MELERTLAHLLAELSRLRPAAARLAELLPRNEDARVVAAAVDLSYDAAQDVELALAAADPRDHGNSRLWAAQVLEEKRKARRKRCRTKSPKAAARARGRS